MNQVKTILLMAVFIALSIFLGIHSFPERTFAESNHPSPLKEPESSYQADIEKSGSRVARSPDQTATTSSIVFTNSLVGNTILSAPKDSLSGGLALSAPAEISDTLTVSFQGNGSGMEECSGDWGYQRITFNMEVDIEVVAGNPIEADGTVTYELSSKTGTIHFYGTAEDVYYGETTIENFDRTQDIDIQTIEGALQYSTGQCSNLYIEFSVPASTSLPYSIYIQYDAELGIVRNTVNMPHPWEAGFGCLGNNYDVPGTDDFDYCSIKLTSEKNPLPPGETTKIHASSCLPIDPSQPLVWGIEHLEGCDVKANITSDGDLGETATISDVEGAGYLIITITNPSFPDCTKQAAILVGCSCGITNDKCVLPGNGILDLLSVAARFNLGRTARGESAGDVFLTAKTPDPANATPQILKVYEFGNDLEVLEDANGLRQIVAPDAFVDITVIDIYSYSISFYDRADLGSKVGGYYEVNPGATPNVTWTIENPDASPSTYNRLRLTENKNGLARISEYQWDSAESIWSLSKGNGLQITTCKEENVGGNRVVTETIKDGSDNIASKVRTTYADIPNDNQTSEEIIEIVEDPDGDALTTTRTWYEDPCTTGNCGKLASQINPDGSWVKYEYDSLGRKILEIRSWLDAPSSAPAGSARTVAYDYAAQDAADSQALEDVRLPRKVTETILGTEVSTTYYIYTNNTDGSRTVITERSGAQGAAYGASGNLRTTTEYYPYDDASADSWRIKSIIHPDGTKDSYAYLYGTYTPNADPTQPGTFALGSGTDILERIKYGTVSSSWGVAYKSIGEQNIYNELGDLLKQSTHVSTGDGYYSRMDWTVHTYDAFGHVLMTSRSDGTRVDSTWDCCGKSSEIDARGIVRNFTYDDLGRMETETKEATDDIATTNSYDAVGRRLTRSVSAGGLSRDDSSVYDIIGRLTQSTDAAALVTGYSYTSGGRITTVTRPGGATEITERYLDSRVKSITGTAVIPRYYTYGVNGNGTRWTRIDTGSPSSPMWEITTQDMPGRTIEMEKPGYTGTVTTTYTYNDLGQLIKVASTGLADTLYVYDEIGNQVQSGLDLDGNEALDPAAMDRITERETVYAQYSSDWWQESVQRVYAEDNSDASTIVSTSRRRLTGLGSGGQTAETVSLDVHGNQTISQVLVDRGAKTETRIIDYPDSTTNEISVTTNGLMTSSQSKTGINRTYLYDSLERQTSITDPRIGTTITHYNSIGQVDYVDDPAGNRSQFLYDPTTGRKIADINAQDKATRYAYNQQGQITHTWGDTTYPVRYIYDSYGRMTEMHTWRSGANWHSETWPTAAEGAEDVSQWLYHEASGLLVQKIDDLGRITAYTYDTGSRLATRTWARTDSGSPLMTTYSYDASTGELVLIDYSDDTPDVSFTYDRLGRQDTVTDAVGNRNFLYGSDLQLQSETVSGLYNKVISFSYQVSGMIGRPTGFSVAPDYNIDYGYDNFGRLNSVGWDVNSSAHSATYTYLDQTDLIDSMVTDTGQVSTYTYEPNRNLRTQIRNEFNTSLISQYDYAYDSLGRRTSVVNSGTAFNAPAFNLFEYNDRNELIDSARYNGSDIGNTTDPVLPEYRGYAYDHNGNRISAQDWDYTQDVSRVSDYTSNELNQYSLISSGTDNTVPVYEEDGNMTAFAPLITSAEYDGENRLTSVQVNRDFRGDIDGDGVVSINDAILTLKVIAGTTDVNASIAAENDVNGDDTIGIQELIFILQKITGLISTDNRSKVEFTYDYMGRRVRKVVYAYDSGSWDLTKETLFVYDGWNLVEEVSIIGASEASRYFVWGQDLSASLQGAGGIGGLLTSVDGTKNYLFNYDGNGNVGQLVNATDGSIAAHYEYDPYGNMTRSDGAYANTNVFRFSTKYHDDETGLIYYGYRYYSPDLGRWLNRDPAEKGLNLYQAVFNDFINNRDYLGLYTWEDAVDSLKKKGKKPAIFAVPSGGHVPVLGQRYTDEDIFAEWLGMEKEFIEKFGKWWESTPKCPTKICVDEKGKATNPDDKVWTDPNPDTKNALILSIFHPGAKYEIRSISGAKGAPHGNQCTYDGKGVIITSIPAAGTADLYGPKMSGDGFIKHQSHDVFMYKLADKINRVPDYYTVRPIW